MIMKIFTQKAFPFLIVLALFIIPTGVIAQPIDPCTDPDDPCPIDSNVIVLIAAAVGAAGKKAYDYKKIKRST